MPEPQVVEVYEVHGRVPTDFEDSSFRRMVGLEGRLDKRNPFSQSYGTKGRDGVDVERRYSGELVWLAMSMGATEEHVGTQRGRPLQKGRDWEGQRQRRSLTKPSPREGGALGVHTEGGSPCIN